MHILVTGGAGFIGSHIVDKLLEMGHQVSTVDNFNDYYNPSFKRQNISKAMEMPKYTLFEGDISERNWVEKIFSDNSFEMIIHLAARAGVRASLINPFLYQKVNVEGTLNILETARKRGVKKITF